jgi:hypothetical protein
MKKFFLSLIIFSVIIFDILLLAAGTYTVIVDKPHLFEGVVLLALGIIMAFVLGLTVFTITITAESSKINMELLKMVAELQMGGGKQKGENPFDLLGSLMKGFTGGPNLSGMNSSIQILGADENGNIKPIAEHNFQPGDNRDEILAKMLNIAFNKEKPAKKAIEEMGLPELKAALKKALEEEKFEKAALLRNKINELEGK